MTPMPSAEPRGRIAVVAGSGSLPRSVLETLVRRGDTPVAILIEGEADEARAVEGIDAVPFRLEDAGALVARLKAHGVDRVVLAGGVARRPKLAAFRWSIGLLRMIPGLVRALRSGDNALLESVIAHLNANGIAVIGAHELVPDLLAPSGSMTRKAPESADLDNIAAGIRAARAIGALDIGQAAVAIGRRVVALEGIEGTEGLLDRVRDLRGHGRIRAVTGGVLVKCVKPDQDPRADLPAIGVRTIEAAHAAGLSGVAVEAGRSFVLDHAQTVARADALGLFLYGFEAGKGA